MIAAGTRQKSRKEEEMGMELQLPGVTGFRSIELVWSKELAHTMLGDREDVRG